MWTIFNIFIELVTTLLLFCFGCLALSHVGSGFRDQGWNLHPLHWKVPLDHQGSPNRLHLVHLLLPSTYHKTLALTESECPITIFKCI